MLKCSLAFFVLGSVLMPGTASAQGHGEVTLSQDGENLGGGGNTVQLYSGPHLPLIVRAYRTREYPDGIITAFENGEIYRSRDGKNLGSNAGYTSLVYDPQEATPNGKVVSMIQYKDGVITAFENGEIYHSHDGENLGTKGGNTNFAYIPNESAPHGKVMSMIEYQGGVITAFENGEIYRSLDGESLGSNAGYTRLVYVPQEATPNGKVVSMIQYKDGVITAFENGEIYHSHDGENLGTKGGNTNFAYLPVPNSPRRIITLIPFPNGDTRQGVVTAFAFELLNPDRNILALPIVLASAGLNKSSFTSELVLTNRGSGNASLNFTYTAAFGGGSGTASDTLPAGQQRIVPDTIAYLKSIGVPIPDSGNRGGTLAVSFSGISSPTDVAVMARTTTAMPQGRAGLAYAGIPTSTALTGSAYLFGLRQNDTDRSNVAIQNMGGPQDGEIVLRLTVFSGNPAASMSLALPDKRLSPGGFKQISGILTSNGLSLTNGYVRIERVGGTAPYYAYAVINDQANSDGSFVPPLLEYALAGRSGLTLPVIVEASSFTSELVLTNQSTTPKRVRFRFAANAIQAASNTADFVISINPGQQLIIPNFVQYLRDKGVAGIESFGRAYVGALFGEVEGGDASGIFLGARTSSPGGGGRYGLFYVGVPYGTASTTSAWLYGLQQNAENRTNLALVNTGEIDENRDVFQIELYDGTTGIKVRTVEGVTLKAKGWIQIGSILAQYSPGTMQGYARVTRVGGLNPFITYAVTNDGGSPGERTGDGAFIASSP
jgi:hypothetical protein